MTDICALVQQDPDGIRDEVEKIVRSVITETVRGVLAETRARGDCNYADIVLTYDEEADQKIWDEVGTLILGIAYVRNWVMGFYYIDSDRTLTIDQDSVKSIFYIANFVGDEIQDVYEAIEKNLRQFLAMAMSR